VLRAFRVENFMHTRPNKDGGKQEAARQAQGRFILLHPASCSISCDLF
jgi:hypothetical protein